MRTITATVFKFSELSQNAKLVAVENWAEELMQCQETALEELIDQDHEVFSDEGYFLTVFDL